YTYTRTLLITCVLPFPYTTLFRSPLQERRQSQGQEWESSNQGTGRIRPPAPPHEICADVRQRIFHEVGRVGVCAPSLDCCFPTPGLGIDAAPEAEIGRASCRERGVRM